MLNILSVKGQDIKHEGLLQETLQRGSLASAFVKDSQQWRWLRETQEPPLFTAFSQQQLHRANILSESDKISTWMVAETKIAKKRWLYIEDTAARRSWAVTIIKASLSAASLDFLDAIKSQWSIAQSSNECAPDKDGNGSGKAKRSSKMMLVERILDLWWVEMFQYS